MMDNKYEKGADGARNVDNVVLTNQTDSTEQQLFHQNIQINHSDSPMCYVEDVYHARCGHWSNVPQVYHQCARVDSRRTSETSERNNSTVSGQTCYNRKTCGSRSEDSTCKRCVAADREKLQRGTCMSVYSAGGRMKVLRSDEFALRMEKGKKRSSREMELKTPKSPDGFFSWTVQRRRISGI